MLTGTAHRGRRIELLLNTLRGERHARRPLLAELVDELSGSDEYRDAAKVARAFLQRLDWYTDDRDIEYERELSVLELAAARRRTRSAAA